MGDLDAKLAGVGGGTGNSIQEMPLIDGHQGATAGAADIDTSAMPFIWIFGACDIYLGTDTTHTIPIVANEKFTVARCDLVHVSAAVKYTWV